MFVKVKTTGESFVNAWVFTANITSIYEENGGVFRICFVSGKYVRVKELPSELKLAMGLNQ